MSDTQQSCCRDPHEGPDSDGVHGGQLLGDLVIPARPEAASPARRILRSTGSLWGIPEAVLERAELPVGEIINNAIRHGARFRGDELSLVFIRIGRQLRIEVHDPSPQLPKRRDDDLLAETGRGMWLIEECSESSGAYLTPAGKAVWCEFAAWAEDGGAVR